MQKFNFMQKGTWSQFIAKLNDMINQKADKTEIPAIPATLPNPHSLSLTGVNETVTYDGSAEKSINLVDLATTEVIYSLEERRIGYWIDGKPLYEKTIDFGNLPNATTKEVSHGIENVDKAWVSDGFCFQNSDFYNVVLSGNNYYNIVVSKTKVIAYTSSNVSDFISFFTVRYTKTTDGTIGS